MSRRTAGPRSMSADREHMIRRNKILRHFGFVNDGTIALLEAERAKTPYSMDRFLYKLATASRKWGGV